MIEGAESARAFESASIETPAFIYDESRITAAAGVVTRAADAAGCKVLYTLKPFALADGIRLLVDRVDGFAAASAFEVSMARDILQDRGIVTLTTPGLRADDLASVGHLVDHISFNSLPQWTRLRPLLTNGTSCGLRINPRLSFVEDARYNPCRISSRLGAPIEDVARALEADPASLKSLEGLHFHSNCDCDDLVQLHDTVCRVYDILGPRVFENIRWLNMGGGYLFAADRDVDALCQAVAVVKRHDGLDVYIEPGATMVRKAGYIVSSVIDIFENDGKTIAILDTTVNHMPEVYEYQFEPDVLDHSDEGAFEYTLAGSSCLAGDIFGSYTFDHPLEVGSRVVFANQGAYTFVKAHMFNGINLPSIYARTPDAQFVLKRRFTYSDFTSRFGGTHA